MSISSLIDAVLAMYVSLTGTCLRLVIVVIGDEVLNGVLREEFPQLVAELGRQGFVVGQHQSRPPVWAITFAIVNVLPVPVAPSSV